MHYFNLYLPPKASIISCYIHSQNVFSGWESGEDLQPHVQAMRACPRILRLNGPCSMIQSKLWVLLWNVWSCLPFRYSRSGTWVPSILHQHLECWFRIVARHSTRQTKKKKKKKTNSSRFAPNPFEDYSCWHNTCTNATQVQVHLRSRRICPCRHRTKSKSDSTWRCAWNRSCSKCLCRASSSNDCALFKNRNSVDDSTQKWTSSTNENLKSGRTRVSDRFLSLHKRGAMSNWDHLVEPTGKSAKRKKNTISLPFGQFGAVKEMFKC